MKVLKVTLKIYVTIVIHLETIISEIIFEEELSYLVAFFYMKGLLTRHLFNLYCEFYEFLLR